MKTYSHERLAALARDRGMSDEYLRDLRIVSSVLPFKVNEYVADQLVDWSAAPDDPIFRLTFPHRDMLPPEIFDSIRALHDADAPRDVLRKAAADAQELLNPHPGDQLEANVPTLEGRRLDGLQHKYAETLLVFPSQGQTCHAYCGYCFRWAQFVGVAELRQALRAPTDLTGYLTTHPEVTDVLFTGGDPMIMKTEVLKRWIEPLLNPAMDSVRTLRFGTKALSYWLYQVHHRLRCRRPPAPAGALRRGGPPRRGDGALLPPEGAGDSCRTGGHRPRPCDRRGDPCPGTPDRARQRQRGRVVLDVAAARGAGRRAVLHVRRAGHRRPQLLRRPPRQGAGHLQRCHPRGLRTGPHRPRPGDVGGPGEGAAGLRQHHRGGTGLLAASAAGP